MSTTTKTKPPVKQDKDDEPKDTDIFAALSEEDREKMIEALKPVISARAAFMNFCRIDEPKDIQELSIINKDRMDIIKLDKPRAEDKSKLAGLNKRMNEARKKIGGHIEIRVKLHNALVKAKENFARH